MTESEKIKLYPGSFLLTASESRDINRVYNTMIQARIKQDIETGDFWATAQEACEACKVNPQRLRRIYDRKLKLVRYWSYYISDVTIQRTGKNYIRYKVMTNAAPIKEVPKEKADAFRAEQDPTKQAEILGINNALYIPASDLHSLQTLISQLGKTDTNEADNIIGIKSSNALQGVFYGKAARGRITKREGYSGTVCEIDTGSGARLTIPESLYNDSIFSPNTIKTLDQISAKAMEQGFINDQIEITLNDYMRFQGLSDRKNAKEKLLEGITNLYNLSIEYGQEDKFKSYTFKGRIIQEHGIEEFKRGSATTIRPRFGAEYFKHMQAASSVMFVDPEIYKIPNNKRTEFYIAYYLYGNARRNIGKEKQERTAGVSTLLSLTDLNYSRLKDKGQASQKIIEPFVNALDYLVDEAKILQEYTFKYRNQNGEDRLITDEDLKRMYTDYSLFSSLVIDYKFSETMERRLSEQAAALWERKQSGMKALKAYNKNKKGST